MTALSTITAAKAALAAKHVSSVELVKEALQNAKRRTSLNAFISLNEELALAQARSADAARAKGERSLLGGVPVALKDLILQEGTRTTAASKILTDFTAPYTATCAAKLAANGGISIGKANLDEFAMGSSNESSAFGPARNPWDEDVTPGGSSGGSAAAVAARIVPGALGTDTGGSIREPAAFCGVVGLKPTYGRVSRYGVIAFASSLDQVGVFATTVADVALLQEAISGHDPADSTSANIEVPSYSAALSGALTGLRLGVPKEYFSSALDAEVATKVQAALAEYEKLGATLVEISLPHTEYAVAAYYLLCTAEASSNLARYDGVRYGLSRGRERGLNAMYEETRGEGFGREVKRRLLLGSYVLSAGYYDAYYVKAQKVRTLLMRDFAAAFERCDAVVGPTTPFCAFPLGAKVHDPLQMYLADVYTVSANMAGLPALSLPCGFNSQGLPIGLQLTGRHFAEGTLLNIAHGYEQRTQWHLAAPKEQA